MTAHNDRRTGTILLTPLTPIHIGSGEVLLPMDYTTDNGRFLVKDVQKFFADHGDTRENAQYALDMVGKGLNIGKGYIRYSLPLHSDQFAVGRSQPPARPQPPRQQPQHMQQSKGKMDPLMAKLMKQSTQKFGATPPPPPPREREEKGIEVREFIKDPFGQPYLPGSSLKGCLRTALAYALAPFCDPNNVISDSLGDRSVKRERIFQRLNGIMFGEGATEDILKAFILRDSAPLDLEQRFAVSRVKVMNTYGERFDEKRMQIHVESLMPSTEAIEIPFYVDLFRLREDRALRNAARGKAIELLALPGKLEESFAAFSKALVGHEAAFYTDRGQQAQAGFMNKLLRNGDICLDLGFGTGWNAKTIGLALEQETIRDVRDAFGRNREGKPNKNMGSSGVKLFPKTRKYIHAGKDGYLPMGWAKLELRWA